MSNFHSQETTPRPTGATGPAPPGDDAGRKLPARLGPYLLLERLGQGGIGAVYRALHTHLRREVAVKVLRPERLGSPTMRRRLLQEAAALGRLDHPNVVRATDADEHEGELYLVMELLDGWDLQKLVARRHPLPVADACELIRQAARGLQYACERGLVHRDVKPSNLILTTAGVVKVLDLGLALADPDPSAAGDSGDRIVGTADYVAPEQALAPHRVDTRADVYGLGCTLYHLLAGEAPFGGPAYSHFYAKVKAHIEQPAPPLAAHRPDVPPALAELVGRMLAKAPEERPATPGDVAAALEPFARDAHPSRLLTGAGPKNGDTLRPGEVTLTLPDVTRLMAPRRAAYIGLSLLVIALAAVMLWGPARSGLTPPDATSPDPGGWHPLFVRKPPLFLQPREGRFAPVEFDARKRELRVAPGGRVMFQLGEARGDYEIRVKIFQPDWSGQAGVFFGLRTVVFRGEPCYRFQAVEVTRNRTRDGDTYFLKRDLVFLGIGDGKVKNTVPISSPPIPNPFQETHELSVGIRDGAMTYLRWDGVDNKYWPFVPNRDLVVSDHEGQFGVLARSTIVFFRDAAVRYSLGDEP